MSVISKKTKEQLNNALKIIGDAEAAILSLKDLQDDLQEEFENKGEKAQEKMMEDNEWLQDFFDVDLQSLVDDVSSLSNLQVE